MCEKFSLTQEKKQFNNNLKLKYIIKRTTQLIIHYPYLLLPHLSGFQRLRSTCAL